MPTSWMPAILQICGLGRERLGRRGSACWLTIGRRRHGWAPHVHVAQPPVLNSLTSRISELAMPCRAQRSPCSLAIPTNMIVQAVPRPHLAHQRVGHDAGAARLGVHDHLDLRERAMIERVRASMTWQNEQGGEPKSAAMRQSMQPYGSTRDRHDMLLPACTLGGEHMSWHGALVLRPAMPHLMPWPVWLLIALVC